METVSNMIFMSLKYSLFLKEQVTKDLQTTYQQYYDNGVEFLKLSLMNELIQTHRVNPHVLTALLRTFALISEQSFDKGDNAEVVQGIGKDLTYLFVKLVHGSECKTKEEETLFYLTLTNLLNLEKSFPLIKKEIQQILMESFEHLKQEVFPQMLKREMEDAHFWYLRKFSVLLRAVAAKKQYLEQGEGTSITSWIITNLCPNFLKLELT
mmetsp:Transcript_23454/g.23103  ORF Transcript_23454/g.23103 Transcript_23454/m.23103 type:complete len:210 (-) Transcript_23454:217-846(-)